MRRWVAVCCLVMVVVTMVGCGVKKSERTIKIQMIHSSSNPVLKDVYSKSVQDDVYSRYEIISR
ncbi:hypothetical protein PASE110613_02625 [Paenibacillus sediminis]|uniref:Uncharacterized protein n=1 Tax=Paenibacillus sediminis TaxID=664909 RepID=A0ABS4GZ35_9BACL|nr:hypothetical protein [Paenibacillus sediminis]MBP1935516.1 hypothetical protein [Paenibacillus sediminis]